MERGRQRQIDTHTDMQTDTDREIGKLKKTEKERQGNELRHTVVERDRQRQTEKDRDRETETKRQRDTQRDTAETKIHSQTETDREI